ncbi:MAG TPA: trigger factor [Prevotella sp.]|jgi:trigger factor|nr:trigger factor [Prevotella sp.]
MKISFENPDKINGLLTLTVEEADYKDNVEKTLKDYRKKANFPGFRPGMVPMGLIKKQFGASAKMDAINKLVGEQINQYIQEHHIQMLGEPLPSQTQAPQDLEKPAPYTFAFDIAVAPEFKIELGKEDKVDYYKITVDDKLIDDQIDMLSSRNGSYENVETYEGNDLMKGDLHELDENGNTKEGGIVVEGASMMPSYIKVEDQKKLFEGAKVGDVITFNPKKAYPDNEVEVSNLLKISKDEAADMTSDFSYQVTSISHFQKAAVDQKLFDSIYGKDTVKTEEEFRKKIAEDLERQLTGDSDYKLLLDIRKYCEDKVGKLTYPDELLKRVMLVNNKDRGQEFIDKNYAQSVKELTWHLIKEQLLTAHNVKIDENDVKTTAKEAARAQFAQYGMTNIPEEYIDNYADEMLKKRENVDGLVDRAVDRKLTLALKDVITLNEKEISLDEFNKMLSGK